LPYKLVGAQRFYGRREIKDVIAYLRLAYNPNDDYSLTRIINVPTRNIGEKTMLNLRVQAQKVGLSPGELLLELGEGKSEKYQPVLPARALVALVNFGRLLARWRSVTGAISPLLLMDRILDDVEYHTYIDDGTDKDRTAGTM
jgi:DNA helicase-2/ATP-dependent DNA helicase PcrA